MSPPRGSRSGSLRARLAKWLKLGGLAMLGLSVVSIPVTLAVVLSATGHSNVLSLGDAQGWGVATAGAGSAPPACRPTRGYYALTFEDGPVPGSTPQLVDALRDAGAVATFFDVGGRAAAHPELVTLQRGAGQVGSHAYTHVSLARISHGRRIKELQATANALEYPNRLFRPPGSVTNGLVEADARASGLQTVLWTVDTRDLVSGVRAVVRRAASVAPGGILRLHEGSDAATAAVPLIVATLRRHGMCPGAISISGTSVFGPDGPAFRATAVKP